MLNLKDSIPNSLTFLSLDVVSHSIIFQFYYKKKGRAEESIHWNQAEVIVKEFFQKPKVYRVEEIELVTVTRNKFSLNLVLQKL